MLIRVKSLLVSVVTSMLRQGKWEVEVVAPTCFESFLPAVKVHGCEFVVVGVGQERVEGLGLVDERPSVRRKV